MTDASRATGWVRTWGLVVLLAVLLAPMPATAQDAQDARVGPVTVAVTELSQLERDGDLLLLHDRLHPDARLEVSRAAFAAWYDGPNAVIPTADPEIVSIEFGAWTWSVTGETYPEAASVVVRQAGTYQGAAIEQTELQHYVFDGTRWRWFFGADTPFVDALAGQTTFDASPAAFGDIAYARVDLVWSEIYAEAGVPYDSPRDINRIGNLPAMTGCGQMTPDEYAVAFYCQLDQEIYYLIEFQQEMTWQFGSYAFPHIIAHEWGHHIQFLEGLQVSEVPELDGGRYVIEQELQADCLAGVYAQEAIARGWLTDDDLNDAYRVTGVAGDTPDVRFDDPVAHGTAEQRQQAFTLGLEDGLFGCNLNLGRT